MQYQISVYLKSNQYNQYNYIVFLQKSLMSKSPRYDLQTYKSIELESVISQKRSQKLNSDNKRQNFYIDKIQSYLALMEKQFIRNMQWQKDILKDFKNQKKIQKNSEKKNHSKDKDICPILKLDQNQEHTLKKILKKFLNIDKENMNLVQMIKLATSLQCRKRSEIKSEQRYSSEENDVIQFPLLPKVVTLNDLAPSTNQNLSSNKASPIKYNQSKLKIPKYQYNKKSPNKLFSAQLIDKKQEQSLQKFEFKSPQKQQEQTFDYRMFNPEKQLKIQLQDSLGKRLNAYDNKVITFKQLQRMQSKQSLYQQLQLGKISLSLSQSKQIYLDDKRNKPSYHNQSVQSFQLLISNKSNQSQIANNFILIRQSDQYIKMDPSKYHHQLNQEQQLSFNNFKKRKIGKYTDREANQPKQGSLQANVLKNNSFYKKMHDSFGNLYHQIPLDKKQNNLNHQNKKYLNEPVIYQHKNIY